MLSRALVSVLCLAVAVSGSLVLHDSRPTPPHGFVHHGAAPTHQTLTLRVGLASANMSGLEATLQRISNPASPEYGQWLTAGMCAVVCTTGCCDAEACTDQVKAYVVPKASTLAAFQAFADANGLSVSPATETSEWVELTTTVAQANALFGASYQTYEHASTGAALTRTLSYSLPVELVGHVDTVTPTTGFEVHSGSARKSRSLGKHSVVPAQCDTSKPNGYITPKCLQVRQSTVLTLDRGAHTVQDMYEIPSQPAKFKNTSLLVTAYDFFAQQADLSAFLKLERPDINPNTTFTFASLDNGTNPQSSADAGCVSHRRRAACAHSPTHAAMRRASISSTPSGSRRV
jgi:tripeptidyl-peptidase-1